MTSPKDPGNPEYTDPEATSAESAEAAAAEAEQAQQEQSAAGSAEPELDPTLDGDLEAALADIDQELADKEAADAASAADAAEAAEPSLEDQLAERTEDLQRLNAEYTNYRRRTERERAAVVDGAKARVITQFLPVLDDLELARQHGDLAEGPLKAIADKLQSILDGQGLVAFGEEGEAFDPEIHEAVQDLSSGGEQVLGTVLRRGFRVGEKLVRTAMVIIADGPAAAAEPAEDGAEGGAEGAAQ